MSDEIQAPARVPFPIVGVGASAGGLEAFTQLLQSLPADTGFGFVLIQHLNRSHPSLLSETLAKATTMPVCQAEHGMQVEPNKVYVIPPNADIAVRGGQIALSVRAIEGPKPHLPIDFLLRSLAAEIGKHAIGVILSGSASDGTEGLRAIQASDGITFVQSPYSAKFPSMPQSAIDAGVVDYTMDIPQLANELVRLSRHPYEQATDPVLDASEGKLRETIFLRLRRSFGLDFREFKQSTVLRRLARRMAVRGANDLPAYVALLDAEPEEARALYEGMLIHVTSFFRDPAVFESLQANAFPEILKHKAVGAPVRIWVAGCSTGEELYSLAIAWLEAAGESPYSHPVHFFGTDASEIAIQKARAGVYSDSAMRDVSDERRARYFTKVDGGHRIHKSVRELCVFVRHDLVRDAPFSKLDLVSCRNVLIYFEQALHKVVLPTLHYALNFPGFLVLGRSENISGLGVLFAVSDKANRIFTRTAAPSQLRFAPRAQQDAPALRQGPLPSSVIERNAMHERHLDRLLLARYSPPGVLVNENMDVLQFRGQTGSYLEAAPGQPQNNLMGMARSGLVSALRATIAQAKQERTVVRQTDVLVEQDGVTKTCDVVVLPFIGLPDSIEPLFIVLFEEPALEKSDAKVVTLDPPPTALQRRDVARLEHELASTKEYLHTLIDDHSRASDELGMSNEELISGNEELQSMNEELGTAKEELQSINEELTTLNDELRSRNQEVIQANSDLLNFTATIDIPIVTLDMDRRIRRFTPKARSILSILPSDVGRPIDDIKLNIDVPDLSQLVSRVISTTNIVEREVRDHEGHWYRMQIRPYTTLEQVVDGAIVSLVDIDALKHLVADADVARATAERADRAKDDFLATLSHELRTPLSSMMLHAQRLSGGKALNLEEQQRTGNSLERATVLQVSMIDALLDVSRIVAGKLTLDIRALDLSAVVQAAIDEVAGLTAEKSILLVASLDPACDRIWADRVRVHQVVSNLLTNAIKFTPQGGHIKVVVTPEAGFARLAVTDTGVGIASSFLPHVFARFSQSDTSITRRHGGLGLGLAIVRHIVEMQGGAAHAESPGEGLGATFSVTFPQASPSELIKAKVAALLAEETSHALDRPGKTLQYASLQGLRILCIDDDQRTREAVSEVLQLTGAHIQLAASASEGRRVLEAFKPHVILCDIAMPDEDGYSFIRKLRATSIGEGAGTPALAFTALASTQDRRRAISAGFQLHLSKPIDIDRLRDAVVELSKMASGSMPSPPNDSGRAV